MTMKGKLDRMHLPPLEIQFDVSIFLICETIFEPFYDDKSHHDTCTCWAFSLLPLRLLLCQPLFLFLLLLKDSQSLACTLRRIHKSICQVQKILRERSDERCGQNGVLTIRVLQVFKGFPGQILLSIPTKPLHQV